MERRRLVIVGAGGHGRSVAEAALLRREFDLAGFLDDGAAGSDIWGMPVLGPIESTRTHADRFDCAIVAIGNNALREGIQARLAAAGVRLVSVVHPAAVVSARAVIGEGTAVMACAVVGTEARLGSGVIVNCGAVVDHHCTVDDFGHLGTGAVMAGGSRMRRGAWMQAGSALGYGVTLGEGATTAPGEGRSRS